MLLIKVVKTGVLILIVSFGMIMQCQNSKDGSDKNCYQICIILQYEKENHDHNINAGQSSIGQNKVLTSEVGLSGFITTSQIKINRIS